jgi:hypothetical protein
VSDESDRLAAAHEAGHCAAAWVLGMVVKGATIEPDEDSGGHMTRAVDTWETDEQQLLALLAGAAAQREEWSRTHRAEVGYLVGGGEGDPASPTSDAAKVVDILEALGANVAAREAYLTYLSWRVSYWVRRELRPYIEALMATLLEHRTVSGRKIEQVFRRVRRGHRPWHRWLRSRLHLRFALVRARARRSWRRSLIRFVYP